MTSYASASYAWRRLLCFRYVPMTAPCQHWLIHRASESVTHMQRCRQHTTTRSLALQFHKILPSRLLCAEVQMMSKKYFFLQQLCCNSITARFTSSRTSDLTSHVTGALKMTDMKLQNMKMADQIAGHENARHEIDGPSSKAWNSRTWKC